MQGDGGTFRLRIATQKLELLTGTLIAGINSSYVAVVAWYFVLRDAPLELLACYFDGVIVPLQGRRLAVGSTRHSTACTTDAIRAFVRQ